jgi:hypothetical protein
MINIIDFKSDTNINKNYNHFSLKVEKFFVFNFFRKYDVFGLFFERFSLI